MKQRCRARRALVSTALAAMLAALFVGGTLLLPGSASAEPAALVAAGFTDVAGTEWFAEAALALGARSVIYPKADGSFGPNDLVTRAEMAVLLNRVLDLAGSDAASQGAQASAAPSAAATGQPAIPFTDVGPYEWYTVAVGNLYAAGLISGTSPTSFSPETVLNRQQAASFIMRALDFSVGSTGTVADFALPEGQAPAWLAGFRDRSLIATQHLSAIANASRLGIVQGDGDGWFYPSLTVTRAQVATMLYRAFMQPLAAKNVYPVELPPVPAYETLKIGSEGMLVYLLESRLTDLHYPCGDVDKTYDERTRDAVMAFEKVEGLSRDGVDGEEVWQRLFTAQTPTPRYTKEGDRVEVDLTRQVLFMISDNVVREIVHVSTGKVGTPTGHGDVWLRQPGWQTCPVGRMYYPCYFYPHIAIHGSGSVPTYPASHGCVRTPTWISPHLYDELPMGIGVDVYY